MARRHVRLARRSYRSPLRAAQAADTRVRLLETTRGLLEREGLAAVTLPAIARAAGVSAPTAYKHFPTLEALLGAFLEWFRPQIGTGLATLDRPPRELVRLAGDNFRRYDAHAAVLTALMDSAAFNRIRVASQSGRARRAAASFKPIARGWTSADLEAAAGLIVLLQTPAAWRWLRETWGLDLERAARAAVWAGAALVEQMQTHPGLAVATKEKRR